MVELKLWQYLESVCANNYNFMLNEKFVVTLHLCTISIQLIKTLTINSLHIEDQTKREGDIAMFSYDQLI